MGVTLTSPRPSHGTLNWDATLETDLANIQSAIDYAASLANGTNLNGLTQSGYYQGQSLTNAPNAGFSLVHAIYFDSNTQVQTSYDVAAGVSYWRRQYSGIWSTWRVLNSDSGWVTGSGTGIAAASGWTIASQRYRQINGIVQAAFVLTKTTAATAAANAAGVVPVIVAATMPAALTPAQANGSFAAVGSGSTVAATGYVNVTGNFQIANLAPSQSVPVGGVLDFMGSFAL